MMDQKKAEIEERLKKLENSGNKPAPVPSRKSNPRRPRPPRPRHAGEHANPHEQTHGGEYAEAGDPARCHPVPGRCAENGRTATPAPQSPIRWLPNSI